MKQFLKIIKINILALLALPLLLFAVVSRLLVNLLEKAAVILGMLVLFLLLMAGFSIFKNPQGVFQVVLYLIVFLVICSLFVMIAVFLMRVAAAFIAVIWSAVIGFFRGIYEYSYLGFLKLFAICEYDYQEISRPEHKVQTGIFCLFYSLLRGMNRLIAAVVSFAFPGAILLSVLLVFGSLMSINTKVKKAFGIQLFQFVGKFDAFSLVYGIVTYVFLAAVFVVVLLSLGYEWHEWARELKMNGEEFSDYIRSMREENGNVSGGRRSTSNADDTGLQEPTFFSGCNTPQKLEKRYKSLCKAYHPDMEGGDKETFQKIQEEYERLKKTGWAEE